MISFARSISRALCRAMSWRPSGANPVTINGAALTVNGVELGIRHA